MEKKVRIGLLIDFLVSEYSEFLIAGVEESCKKVGADYYIFQMGELQNRSQNFDYQYVAITAFLSKNNVDGLIFVSSTQTHNMSFDSYVSYLTNSINTCEVEGIINTWVDIDQLDNSQCITNENKTETKN